MKIKTETILTASKYLALAGGIWFSILCGGQLLTLISGFINLDWAKRTYEADMNLFSIREHSVPFYVWAMSLNIAAFAIKALVWYVVYELLKKLKLQNPFSSAVELKLERIAWLLLGVWIISSPFWNMYNFYVFNETGIHYPPKNSGDEYLFMAGMVYIISQIFKRGIEIQAENDLTV